MDLWKYYDGDLKYPDITKYSHEKEIAKVTSRWAYEYAKKHGKDEELEPIIAKNPEYSYLYANDILKGPFKLGEKAIAEDGYYSFVYAKLLKRRFEFGEPAIAKTPSYSYWYAKDVLKGPFPLGEKAIARMKQHTNAYTNEVLKKDFYLDGKLICKYEG